MFLQLSAKRKVVVNQFRGKTLVSVREYYEKDGKVLPSSKGLNSSINNPSCFKSNVMFFAYLRFSLPMPAFAGGIASYLSLYLVTPGISLTSEQFQVLANSVKDIDAAISSQK